MIIIWRYRYHELVLLLVGILSLIGCSPQGNGGPPPVPTSVGKWQVQVAPATNEYYEEPESMGPPPESVMRWIQTFTPEGRVTGFEYEGGTYEVDVSAGAVNYDYAIKPGGELIYMAYSNDTSGVELESSRIVYQGTREAIPVENLPAPAVKAVSALVGHSPDAAWSIGTPAGPRVLFTANEYAFVAREDGKIQAAGRTTGNFLQETTPWKMKVINPSDNPGAFKAQMDSLLSPYREEFNFQNQIRQLQQENPPGDDGFRFVVMGDSKGNRNIWTSLLDHINRLNPAPKFIINTGDIVRRGHAKEFATYYIPPILRSDVPMFVAIGNHDMSHGEIAREYRYLFGENSLNYYFDYGGARFIFLDNVTNVGEAGERLMWLDSVLAETPDDYLKFVACHRPPRTIRKWAYHGWREKPSRRFVEIMGQHNVTEVFLGHIHAFSTATRNGVKYTISAGGGAKLHHRYGPKGNVYHYTIVDVRSDGTLEEWLVQFRKTGEQPPG